LREVYRRGARSAARVSLVPFSDAGRAPLAVSSGSAGRATTTTEPRSRITLEKDHDEGTPARAHCDPRRVSCARGRTAAAGRRALAPELARRGARARHAADSLAREPRRAPRGGREQRGRDRRSARLRDAAPQYGHRRVRLRRLRREDDRGGRRRRADPDVRTRGPALPRPEPPMTPRRNERRVLDRP